MNGRKPVTGKSPPGVHVRGAQIRISFRYRHEHCFEPIPCKKVDKASIKYAANKRAGILAEIKEGRFNYATHFPNSSRASKFSDQAPSVRGRSVADGVADWLAIQQVKKATSTHRNYASKAKHITAEWPEPVKIADVTMSHIEAFQVKLIKRGLSPKTVNDIFTVVRGVWRAAFADGVISADPLTRIDNLERDDNDLADPFSLDELAVLEAMAGTFKRPQDIEMLLFNCWSGLSESELLALAWEDIDLRTGVAKVRRARVDAEYKVPKEKGRAREVHLVDNALRILTKQRARTFMRPAVDITVTQRDNHTTKTEQVTFVFLNEQPGGATPWHARSWFRWFTRILKSAKIRHRGANQCRHTYASQLLSHYAPLEIVAREMGHSDTTMVKKHYGRFISQDAPNVAPLLNQLLSAGAARACVRKLEMEPKRYH